MSQGMLNRSEVLNYLGCDSKALNRHIKKKELTVYKIGGEFERFNRDEVIRVRLKNPPRGPKSDRSLAEHLKDFWHYNNFYIITSVVLVSLIFYFFRK